MKRQWLAYLVVALLSIGAGVAIAGLPDDTPAEATIVAPSTTLVSSTSSDATPTTEPDTTEPAETTEPEPTTTATTTTAPSTSSSSSTSSTSTTEPSDELPPRSGLFTIVANGANISGAAARNVELLRALGYTDIAARNGTTIFDFTTVYFANGFDAAAERLADDLELLPDFVAPLSEAPEVLDLPAEVELLAYIGLDRAG